MKDDFMKPIYSLSFLLLISCTVRTGDFILRGYDLDIDRKAAIGDAMISWGFGKLNITGTSQSRMQQFRTLNELMRLKSQSGYAKEFIYLGTNREGMLRCVLREYYVDGSSFFIKPSYSLDLDYDISESKVIGIQGFEIEILSADQRTVHYKVIKEPGTSN